MACNPNDWIDGGPDTGIRDGWWCGIDGQAGPRDAMSRGPRGSERDSEANLTDPLFRLLEIPGIRDRLHEAGLLCASRGVDALRGNRRPDSWR